MNIFYLANMRFPNEKAHGKQVREMCNALAALSAVTLVVPTRTTQGTPEDFGLSPRVRVVRIPVPDAVRFGRAGFFLTAFFFALGSGMYTLVHRRDAYVVTRDYPCAVLPALARIPTAWESHRGEWNFVVHLAIQLGAVVIVISRGLQTLYESKGVSQTQILLAPDGVDLSRYSNLPTKEEARRTLALPQDKKIVIYNGHLHTWKGAGTLAQTAQFLTEDFILIFMGGTDEDIGAFKKQYGHNPRLNIIGRKPDTERPLYLRAADVAVLPNVAGDIISATYTSPLKLFGYMAAEVPIVASDLPSIREILSEKTAYFARAGDPKSLAEALVRAVQDPGARIRARQAREEALRYDWRVRAKHIVDFLL